MPERLIERLQELGEVRVLAEATSAPLSEQADLSDVEAIAHFGGQFTSACLSAAPRLRAIGGVWDNAAHGATPIEIRARTD